jgi:hypothetical protein
MLIIQVAIGVVLGLIIFAYLPQLIAFGIVFVAIAIALIAIGLLLFTEVGQGVVAGLVIMFGLSWLATQLTNSSGNSDPSEASPDSGSTVGSTGVELSTSARGADDIKYPPRSSRISAVVVAGLLGMTILATLLLVRYG